MTVGTLIRRAKKVIIFGSLVIGLLALSACDEVRRTVKTGPLETSSLVLNKDKVERADVELNISAGELKIQGGSDKLIDGNFSFNVPDWRPQVRSSVNGLHAAITVQQPTGAGAIGDQKNIWELELNDKVLLDLALHCGAGEAKMNLGSLNLRSLQVRMGAGQVDLDLTGHPTRDYEVDISGGVGQATIHLPEGVGIRAEAHGGLGSINVSGLEKKGDHYENDLYDSAKVNVTVKVNGGIGEIRIIG